MRDDDQDKAQLHDRDHVGIVGGAGATFVGIDAAHLDVDGRDAHDEKTRHDRSWKTRAEEEPDEVDESGDRDHT